MMGSKRACGGHNVVVVVVGMLCVNLNFELDLRTSFRTNVKSLKGSKLRL